jgi:hypothetical protein
MRVFLGSESAWQYAQDTFETFGRLWPEILQVLTELTPGCTGLIFFSGQATREEMFSMWPCLPFGSWDATRYYVSEVCRDSRVAVSPPVWVCVEYIYEEFRRLVGPEGFTYSYGMTIMGISVTEASVKEYLRRDLFDEAVLEMSLRDCDLRSWWLCDADFEGMTIWHKDLTGVELAERIRHRGIVQIE